MISSLIFSALMVLPVSRASSAIYNLTGAHATVYYDLTNSLCGDAAEGDPFQPNWAVTSGINDGIPYCQGQVAKSLADLGTNRIVAMNMDMVRGDPSEWCGKEVQIIQADGTPFQFDEGPLFIWDACAACASAPIVDLSAAAFVQLKGGTCAGNNPGGLTVQVLDNNIWDWDFQGGSSGDPSTSQVAPIPSSSVAPSPSSSATFSSSSKTTQVVATSSKAVISSTKPTTTIQALVGVGGGNATSTLTPTVSAAKSCRRTRPTRINPSIPAPSAFSNAIAKSTDSDGTDGTGMSCVYGKWQCDGRTLQVCNYVTISELAWETIANCTSVCEFTQSGSVICQ